MLNTPRQRNCTAPQHSTIPANTRRSPNAGPILAHRLLRWPSIKSALVSTPRVCWAAGLAVQADADAMSVKCWASVAGAVGPPSVTLAHIRRGVKHDTVTQYWANVGSASLTVGQQ